jgi:hypothetical protein
VRQGKNYFYKKQPMSDNGKNESKSASKDIFQKITATAIKNNPHFAKNKNGL